MKRYKDCALVCKYGQLATDLLNLVMQVCSKKGYQVDRYSTMTERDTLAVYIHENGLPYSRLIVCANSESNVVAIVNIVPMPESGISHIEYAEYNKLLDLFREQVFGTINHEQGNEIRENSEEYNIEDVIPKSYTALNSWLNMHPLSEHPLDTKRWYAFVVALHENNEYLSLDDFAKYIMENYEWPSDKIEEFSLRLESQLELLEYYDNHR